MASVASQLIQEVTVRVQKGSLEDAREKCADGTYFLNNLRIYTKFYTKNTLIFFKITVIVFNFHWILNEEILKFPIQTVKNSTKIMIQINLYRVSQEEWTKLRESVPYVELFRYNPKHLYPKLNGYGDNGQRNLKLWQLLRTYWLPNTY